MVQANAARRCWHLGLAGHHERATRRDYRNSVLSVIAAMNQQAIAIVIAGALIAAAIALTNHWELHQDDPMVRLNRWTGAVVLCLPFQPPGGTGMELEFHCPRTVPLLISTKVSRP